MKILNSKSCLNCEDFTQHNKEIDDIFSRVIFYKDYDVALICKYQDLINANKEQEIINCKFSEIWHKLERFDFKNGVDLLSDGEYLNLLIYGQEYKINKRYYITTVAVKVCPYNDKRIFINILPVLEAMLPVIAKTQFQN